MDHLWMDREMQQEPDSVTYVEPGEWLYTPHEDDEWLAKVQVSFEHNQSTILRHLHWPRRSTPITKEIFAQEALFFRLLARYCALLGVQYHREDFITVRQGNTVLSTLKLQDLAQAMVKIKIADFNAENHALVEMMMSQWQQEQGVELSADEAQQLFKSTCQDIPDLQKVVCLGNLAHNEQLLSSMNALFEEFKESLTAGLQAPEQLDAHTLSMLLACCVLLESLSRAFELIYGHFGSKRVLRDLVDLPSDAIWLNRARQNGLCAQRVESLISGSRMISQNLIATSMRFNGKHETCEFGKYCQATPSDAQLPRHHECDGCPMVVLTDKARLEQCIETKGYGLLRFGDDVDFRVVEEGSYVAFSHVWSHGLGNPLQNGLPECQLRRLKKYVVYAGCDSFWLDPICVPLDSTWKLRAIDKMDVVYKKAAKVIVLDNDLLKCRGTSVTKRIAMLMSDWITRIWTLQEASFPGNRLYVAFADGLSHVETLLNDNWNYMVCSDEAFLAKMMLGSDSALALAENFHNRTTSHAEDEAICLSILLNVQMSKSVPQVIGQLDSIEQDLIYAPGMRCDKKGMRWCPMSLLSTDRRKTYEPRQTKVRMGDMGLFMKKDVVKLGMLNFKASEKYLIWFLDGQDAFVAFCENGLGATEEQLRSRWINDAALVLEKSSDLKDAISGAILVSNSETSAHYECMMMTVELRKYVAREGMDIMRRGIEIYASRMNEHEIWVD